MNMASRECTTTGTDTDENDQVKVENDDETEEDPVDSDDRIRRRLFNKHLKQRDKWRKYETRIQQAIFRKDAALEKRAKQDWDDYRQRLQDDPNSFWNYEAQIPAANNTANRDPTSGIASSQCCQLHLRSLFRHVHSSLRSWEERDTPRVQAGSATLLKFRERLVLTMLEAHALRTDAHQPHMDSDSETAGLSSKERQTRQAEKLKANMHKGTQTKSMFEDELALLGYTRQKFHERAVLAFSSLDRLDPSYRDTATKTAAAATTETNIEEVANNQKESPDQEEDVLLGCIWDRLLSTEQVVSIGCGPGCDALGVLGFLESHGVEVVNGIIFLDFVIDKWKKLVLEPLIPMIVPQRVPSCRTVVCDVQEPLVPSDSERETDSFQTTFVNHAAYVELTRPSEKRHKLIVVSYLLTETRHRWKSFFEHLLGILQGTESLLLLTEPTAWQLSEFLKCFGTKTDEDKGTNLLIKAHVWLDSSRDLPHLQDLDKRNGPAILLVCTN